MSENKDLDNNNNETIDRQDHIISMAVMNYVASSQFRNYMAHMILRTNNIRATILWEIIQRSLPVLNQQMRSQILENSDNIGDLSLDILEATDAMLRLRNAFSRVTYL